MEFECETCGKGIVFYAPPRGRGYWYHVEAVSGVESYHQPTPKDFYPDVARANAGEDMGG
jgi:hypothetical protein